MKKRRHIDNKKFYDTIVEYKKKVREAEANGTEKPRIPEFAGRCIEIIAEGMAKRYHKFSRYSYNDEMKSDAIMNCIKYFDNFDETKFTNPHAYFTKICYQASVERIKTEKRQQYVKYKTFENEMVLPSDPDIVFHENHGLIHEEMYDNISEYIDDFEKKEEIKKKERKEKAYEKRMRDSLERYMVEEEDDGDK